MGGGRGDAGEAARPGAAERERPGEGSGWGADEAFGARGAGSREAGSREAGSSEEVLDVGLLARCHRLALESEEATARLVALAAWVLLRQGVPVRILTPGPARAAWRGRIEAAWLGMGAVPSPAGAGRGACLHWGRPRRAPAAPAPGPDAPP